MDLFTLYRVKLRDATRAFDLLTFCLTYSSPDRGALYARTKVAKTSVVESREYTNVTNDPVMY